MITGTEDLDAFLQLPQTTYTYENELDLTPYEVLREVDYTQNVVLMIGYIRSETITMSLDRLWVHENNLVVRYVAPTKYGGSSPAFDHWCYALLIDRDDMPTLENDLQILYHIDFPNLIDTQQKEIYPGYPAVTKLELVPLQNADDTE